MLMKNRNTFDFKRKKRFKTLTHNNLGGGPLSLLIRIGGLCICTLCTHIPKATTGCRRCSRIS